MLNNNLHLLRDIVGMKFYPAHDAFHGRTVFDFCFVPFLSAIGELESEFVGSVILKNIKNELLFNCLPHRIDVKRLRQIVFTGWF